MVLLSVYQIWRFDGKIRLKIFLTTFLLVFVLISGLKSNNLPLNYFDWPVKHKVRLSGTFGELRTNHFHGGLDIKSEDGGIGDRLYSAAEGYISRISVQPNGYGNALFITHPNGYTTVYGHLSGFSDAISEYLKKQQYQNESFSQDIDLDEHAFPVKKGDYIGKMGNSGSSQGPHLHFEIRESSTNKQMNPLLFGLNLTDNIAPSIYSLKVYEFSDVNELVSSKTISVKRKGGKYFVQGDTIETNGYYWGLALKAYDKHDNTHNRNGVYAMAMELDGASSFSFSMDAIPARDTRYLNAHLDYRERVTHRAYFNRFFKLPGNKLDIYKGSAGDGLVSSENEVREVRLKVEDINGNTSVLKFYVKEKRKKVEKKEEIYNYYLFHNHPNLIAEKDFEVFFPKNSLYKDEMVHIEMQEDRSDGYYSDVLKLHKSSIPLHKPANIALKIRDFSSLDSSEYKQLYIGKCDSKGRKTRIGTGTIDEGFLTTQTWGFGNYAVFMDKVKPSIRPIVFSYNARRLRRFRFVIKDDVRSARSAGPLRYRAEVDGQWILMIYDQKYHTITHYFDGSIKPGKHKLRLVVEDQCGNQQIFEKEFIK